MSSNPLNPQPPCSQEDLASLYALGMLESAAIPPFEEHLDACERCRDVLRQSQPLALGLADCVPLLPPPAHLRKRVLAQAALPKGSLALVRGSGRKWRPTAFAGVSSAPLYVDRENGEVASLVRMDVGAVFPPHRHSSVEHIYVLEGDVVFDDHVLNAGDYEAADAGTRHSQLTTRTGCLVFLINNKYDVVSCL